MGLTEDGAASRAAPVLPETNVAAVAHRSVFRYPGGKTWLVPILRRWVGSLPQRPGVFVEPFAGGAICGLTVAAEGLADRVVLAEIDPNVTAVWHAIFTHGAGEELSRRIETFQLTRDTVEEVLRGDDGAPVEQAFRTILRNRVQRGGILAPGAGLMKVGENGRGLASRWYPETLARRIRDTAAYRHKVTVLTADACEVLERYRGCEDVAALLDHADVRSHLADADAPLPSRHRGADPRLRACVHALAHRRPHRWLRDLADVDATVASGVADDIADAAAWTPPATPTDLALALPVVRSAAAVADPHNPRVTGATLADRIRHLADAPHRGDTPSSDYHARALLHAISIITGYALHHDPDADDHTAAAVAYAVDTLDPLDNPNRTRHTGTFDRVGDHDSRGTCHCDPSLTRRARWIVTALTRSRRGDIAANTAAWLRDLARRGDVDLTPLLDAPQPGARAAAVTAHGDADDRARLLADPHLPSDLLANVVAADGDDATRLARHGAPARHVAYVAHARADLPNAAPGMLTALFPADADTLTRIWDRDGPPRGPRTRFGDLVRDAVAAADPDELAALHGRGDDLADAADGDDQWIRAALARDDLDDATRQWLLGLLTHPQPDLRPDVGACVRDGCLRDDELARVCAADPDVAARVAAAASHPDDDPDAVPHVRDQLRRAAAWLPLDPANGPSPLLADATAHLAGQRLGDDPDAWQTLFALLPDWRQTIGELVDTAAAVRHR